MSSFPISVMTVPATDETTAALTDSLLRELLPRSRLSVRASVALPRRCAISRCPAHRIRSPWRLWLGPCVEVQCLCDFRVR